MFFYLLSFLFSFILFHFVPFSFHVLFMFFSCSFHCLFIFLTCSFSIFFHYCLSLFSFSFFQFLFMFFSFPFHFLSFSFIFFHFRSFSFIFVHFLSFSFIFLHFLSFSFSLLGARNLIFLCLNLFPFFPRFFPPFFFLALPVGHQLVTIWVSVKIRLRVVYGGRRVGQVLPSYQNRQISALDETADARHSSLYISVLSILMSLLQIQVPRRSLAGRSRVFPGRLSFFFHMD